MNWGSFQQQRKVLWWLSLKYIVYYSPLILLDGCNIFLCLLCGKLLKCFVELVICYLLTLVKIFISSFLIYLFFFIFQCPRWERGCFMHQRVELTKLPSINDISLGHRLFWEKGHGKRSLGKASSEPYKVPWWHFESIPAHQRVGKFTFSFGYRNWWPSV